MRKSVQIQAWLHPEKIREYDAVEALKFYRAKGWADRQIIREALIALRSMEQDGWQAQPGTDEVKLTADFLSVFRQLQSLSTKLTSMDFTAMPRETAEGMQQELTEFQKSASALLGDAIFFDEDDK